MWLPAATPNLYFLPQISVAVVAGMQQGVYLIFPSTQQIDKLHFSLLSTYNLYFSIPNIIITAYYSSHLTGCMLHVHMFLLIAVHFREIQLRNLLGKELKVYYEKQIDFCLLFTCVEHILQAQAVKLITSKKYLFSLEKPESKLISSLLF